MRRLIAQPATVIISDHAFSVVAEAWLSDEHEKPLTLEAGTYSTRLIDIGTVELDYLGMLKGITAESGFPITVRTVEPDDAVGQAGFPNFPLPIPVIGAILAGENMDTHVEALVGDDGYVNTLLLVTDVGLWVRYSSQWIRLWDVDPINALNSVEVADEAVDLYDAADRAGNMLPVSSLPGPEKSTGLPQAPELISVTVAPSAQMTFTAEAPTTASAAATITLRIDTADDLPAAIQAAVIDPSIRWYVERRAGALNPEMVLPWLE